MIADNCTDRTKEKAELAGNEFDFNVKVLVTENNNQRKVGALNTAWKKIYGDTLDLYNTTMTKYQQLYKESSKAILGMDADSRLAPQALIHL